MLYVKDQTPAAIMFNCHHVEVDEHQVDHVYLAAL
jgi:hypothetical protein